MSNMTQRHNLLSRFGRNEDGNMAMTFALTITMMAGLVGAAIDFSTLSNAHKRSQSIADAAALNAAIFVKNNDRPPKNNQEGYMDGVVYTAAELGYDFKGWVEGGSENVTVQVDYDDSAKEATVTVKGNTIPTFMQVMGRDKLPFSTQSVVSYLQVDEAFPASIALVLDNSGSMRWDDKLAENVYYDEDAVEYGWEGQWKGDSPADAQQRIAGLKTSVKNFTSDLNSRIGTQDPANGQRMVRMGMLPYSSAIITSGQVDMAWGYVSDTKIDQMTPSGSTNSNPPMREAKNWLDVEEQHHIDEAARVQEDYKEALQFVIFMTDGQNTVGNFEFVPDDESNRYYAYKSLFGKSARWWYSGSTPYDADFREGWLRRDTDRLTIETCEEMHEDEVEVYTIGYALEVGKYNSNDTNYPKAVEEVTHEVGAAANALLSACASKPENFILADNAEQLNGAFDRIQNAIVEELIRIKS